MWGIVAFLIILALLFGIEGMRAIVGGGVAIIGVIIVLGLICMGISAISPKKADGKKDYSWIVIVIVAIIAIVNWNGSGSQVSDNSQKYYLWNTWVTISGTTLADIQRTEHTMIQAVKYDSYEECSAKANANKEIYDSIYDHAYCSQGCSWTDTQTFDYDYKPICSGDTTQVF